MTHKELIPIAYKYVLKNCSCGVAFKELNSLACNGECPDVIGFGAWGHSVLIECKVSRSDFLADRKKSFRQVPELGMGSQRFYMCPDNLIKKEEIPEGWGLIYVNSNGKPKCVYSPYKGNIEVRTIALEKNIKAEHGIMYSALRRLFIKGHLESIYDKDYQHKSVEEILEVNNSEPKN